MSCVVLSKHLFGGNMPVSTPTTHQILEIASMYRLALTEEDATDFRRIMQETLASYRRLDELPEPTLPVRVPRTPGHRPGADENPYNGWYWKT
jgi:amidase